MPLHSSSRVPVRLVRPQQQDHADETADQAQEIQGIREKADQAGSFPEPLHCMSVVTRNQREANRIRATLADSIVHHASNAMLGTPQTARSLLTQVSAPWGTSGPTPHDSGRQVQRSAL